MYAGIGGHPAGVPDDPFVVLTTPLDEQRLPGPIKKPDREDLQVQSALNALAANGVARGSLTAKHGEDPPDRYVILGDRRWATELTELTVQDIRGDLAVVRRFGRRLQEPTPRARPRRIRTPLPVCRPRPRPIPTQPPAPRRAQCRSQPPVRATPTPFGLRQVNSTG